MAERRPAEPQQSTKQLSALGYDGSQSRVKIWPYTVARGKYQITEAIYRGMQQANKTLTYFFFNEDFKSCPNSKCFWCHFPRLLQKTGEITSQ